MRRIGLAVAVAFLLLPGVTRAATYTVNTTSDSSGGSCTAQKCSLRDAMSAVNAHPGTGDAIIVPAGTYTLAGTELPAITNPSVNLTIAGAGASATTISANGQSRVFEIDDGTVAISGVTVTDGSVDATSGTNLGGAGIENLATLSLTDAAVTDSVETGGGDCGGGILSTQSLSLDGDTVSGNKAANDGGGVCVDGGTASIGDSTITGNVVDSTLPGAGGSGEFGGGVEFDSGPISLADTTIAGNSLNPAGNVGAGGGLDGAGGITIDARDAIIAGNDPTDCDRTLTSTGPNLDGDSTCFTGASDLHANPLLQPLADNGGQTDTLALPANSPAVGSGANCAATDQRGIPHPAGTCDLGAYQTTPPFVITGASGTVSKTSATLFATVNPDDQFTVAYFQYGPFTSYGSTTPGQVIGSDFAAHQFMQNIGSLTPGTTYHFRIVSISARGTSYGADQTFTTPAPPPHLTVGGIRVKGLTFSIPLSCQAASTCNGTVALVLNERLKGGKVVAARSRTVIARQVSFTLPGGGHKRFELIPGQNARALLARLHRLTVTVRVTLTSAGQTLQTVTRSVTVHAT